MTPVGTQPIWKSGTRLADGREIVYFDAAPGLGRAKFAAHLQVLSVRRAAGKLKYLAGTGSGTGVWINDIIPQEAAQRLREA